MNYDEADTFLSLGGEEELGEFMAHLKKFKLDKKTKKKKINLERKEKTVHRAGR